MRVIAQRNQPSELSDSARVQRYPYGVDNDLCEPQIIGETYTVYALIGGETILIAIGSQPTLSHIDYFDIVSPLLSPHWRKIVRFRSEEQFVGVTYIGYQDLVERPEHLERLLDGDDAELEVFNHWRTIIDSEGF